MISELRPIQLEALANIRATIGQGVKRIVLQAPTGYGKTKVAAAIADGASRKKNRLAFVVPAISLIDQTISSFWDEGIKDIAAMQANHPMTDPVRSIQVCSIQTISSRGTFPEADIVIFDECHSLHNAHKLWLKDPAWAKVPFIGMSATPWSKGLGKYFETLLVASTTQELIDQGYLSKFRVFSTGHPDLSSVKTVAGDYHEGQLSTAMQGGTLTADIVSTWQARWGQDRTLCFAVDRAHAKALQARFEAAGIACGYQDANTPQAERSSIRKRFHSGEYRIVVNIGTLTTGVDWDVRCLILARPTKSEILFTQIIGRALRTAEGKESALILDHASVHFGSKDSLGFVTGIHHDRLDDGKPKPKAERKPVLPKECGSCHALRPRGPGPCPHCGFKPEVTNEIVETDGELVELVPGQSPLKQKGKNRDYSPAEKREWFAMLKGYAQTRDKSEKWVLANYREKFHEWPRTQDVAAQEPSYLVLSWIKSRMIAWAKSKKQQEVAHA